jgi:hypothetical protein
MVSSRLGHLVGGLVLTFPFLIGSGFLFSFGSGEDAARAILTGAAIGMVALVAFIGAGLLGLHLGWGYWSLLVAVTAWLVVALAILIIR